MRRWLLLITVPFLLLSCERIYINGDLDGMWKLHSVESADTVRFCIEVFDADVLVMNDGERRYSFRKW